MVSYLLVDKIQGQTLKGLSTSIDPGDWSDMACPLMMINRCQSFELQVYAKWDATGHITLYRNTNSHGTAQCILLSWSRPWPLAQGSQRCALDPMDICISHRGNYSFYFFYWYDFTIHSLIVLTIFVSYSQVLTKIFSSRLLSPSFSL